MKKTYPSPNDTSHCHLGLLHISHMWVVEPSHHIGSRQVLQEVADWVMFGGCYDFKRLNTKSLTVVRSFVQSLSSKSSYGIPPLVYLRV